MIHLLLLLSALPNPPFTLVHGWSIPRLFRPSQNAITAQKQTGQLQQFEFEFDRLAPQIQQHQFFMSMALDQAKKAGQRGEVPIGAIIVRNVTAMKLEFASPQHNPTSTPIQMELLSTSHNLIETTHDASAHAELLALRHAASKIQNWRLRHCILYSTLEPCPMCLSAMLAFRVDGLVYAAPDLRLGAVRTNFPMLETMQHPFHNVSWVVEGVHEETSAELLRDFFRKRRQKAKDDMAKARLELSKEGGNVTGEGDKNGVMAPRKRLRWFWRKQKGQ